MEGGQGRIHYRIRTFILFVILSCPFNINNIKSTTQDQILSSLVCKTRRLRISEFFIWLLICQPRAAEKARALENCFPTYVFVFRQMCLFEGLNTMEIGTMEIHSWGVEVLEVLTQSLILLCDGLNATCFSLLCVGSFRAIFNNHNSVGKARNLQIFYRD